MCARCNGFDCRQYGQCTHEWGKRIKKYKNAIKTQKEEGHRIKTTTEATTVTVTRATTTRTTITTAAATMTMASCHDCRLSGDTSMFAPQRQVDGCWRRRCDVATSPFGSDSTQFVHLTAFIFIIFTFASRLQHAPQIITTIIRTHCPRRCPSANGHDTLIHTHRLKHTHTQTHIHTECCILLLSLFAFHCKLHNKLLLVNAGEGSSCILFGRKQFKPELMP